VGGDARGKIESLQGKVMVEVNNSVALEMEADVVPA